MSRLLAGASALALGAFVLAEGTPHAMAELWRSFQNPVMAAVYDLQLVTPAELQAAAASRRLALEWVPATRSHTDRAVALLTLIMMQAPDDPVAHPDFDEVVALLEGSLARGPADPIDWARLAYLRFLRDGPGEAVRRPLALSLATGPEVGVETRLVRIETALEQELAGQATGLEARIDHDIRRLWAEQRRLVLALAEADALLRQRFAQALVHDEEASAFLDALAAPEV